MTPPPPRPREPRPLDADRLLGESAWLRRLARALTGDDASADDLVQDALGAAIAARQPIEDLRGFLAGALRRRSHEVRRSDARRRRREADRASNGPALQGADEAAERADTMRVVLEELGRLPASQRDTLVLRYVEGLEPGEIARRSGLAPPTVRAHLARGLASLRQQLDRRPGGRDAWVTALAPWAGAPVRPELAPSLSVGVAGAAAAATSTAVMGWKTATAVTVSLVAFGLWAGLTHRGAPVEREIAAAHEPEREDPALAEVARGGGSRVAVKAPAPVNKRADAVSAARPSAAQDVRTAGRVVDAWTGEPVPWMKLRFRTSYVPFEGDRATATPGSADPDLRRSRTGPIEFDAESDVKGAFQLPVGLRGEEVQFVEEDEPRYGWGVSRSRRVELPLPDPLEVRVGPTFQLEGSPPAEAPWKTMEVRFATGPDDGRQDMRTAVREGARPWLRFAHRVGQVAGDGPWTLEFGDREGLWWAEAEVTRKRGIEPYPVAVDFEQRGAIEFLVPCRPDRPIPSGAIGLETDEGRALRSVFLYTAPRLAGDDSPPLAKARARYLIPGRYRWSRGGASGEVEVVAGEVVRVEIEENDGGATFDVEILVDATAVLEASPPGETYDLRGTALRLSRTDDPLNGVVQVLAPDPARGPGHWRLEVNGLADVEWNLVALGRLSEIRLEPRHVRITRGMTPPVLIASRVPNDAAIAVKAVDAETGEPLPSAEAALSLGDSAWQVLRANDDGSMSTTRLPSDRELMVLARAPGYRMTRVRFHPVRDGVRHEVALRPGWSSVVHVLDSGSFQPVEGVELIVDGAPAGWTDAGGMVEIEGDGPPDSIELGGGASDLEVTLSSIDRPGGPTDPIAGYRLYVRRR